MDVDEHIDLVDTLGDMLGQKDVSKKDKFIDTMPTIIQTHLITEKDWAVTTKKAKELEHINRKCNPLAAALPTLAKGTTVPSLYSHIAHSNDKDEAEILQPFKGAHPKQPKPRGGGKGKQPQQKPKNTPPPPQTQDDQYNYEDTNNYYHNENYRGQSRGHRPYRGQNTGCSFRGQTFLILILKSDKVSRYITCLSADSFSKSSLIFFILILLLLFYSRVISLLNSLFLFLFFVYY